MKSFKKRGLSPVIASVLLIAIALVLATIIFLWAKTWIGEKIQKDLGGGPEAIESFCKDVQFVVDVDKNGNVNANNLGNIPIYGVEIKRKVAGSIENLGTGVFNNGLDKGAKGSVSITFSGRGVNVGDELIVSPILLGETNEYKKPHVCADEFSESVKVVS